ncbi:outer membrane beta-barrel protein [Ferruginibacter sp. HRS2-29]|uniref:outer membrane beta-barrel protein n=1 Tax=Ferruginibacter sp. HRS2-29 TaxID=2487334 RepID=UPI0020CDDA41|nr:outer membrane beta-barrel protein [Ferruginibacter sp. HRS2-29]MCP9749967.1 TonB-dependent receptor [Ferruginibacter sp. HRS2-29]
MKTRLAALFLLYFLCNTAIGQAPLQPKAEVKVTLIILNERQEPVTDATVTISSEWKDSLVRKKAASQEIYFWLPENTTYRFEISAVTIVPFKASVNIGNNDTTLSFTVRTSSKELTNVVVVSRKPLIKQDDDKTVVDAELLANSSTNAYEVLEKTPGAVVDQDGNVYLNSATPAQIQINGKEVKLSTADVASLLKSLPANSVVKIEVLRSPSAKYDASGSGGIINIVLKKGVKIGTNGNVNASFFQGRFNTKSIGFNLNSNAGKTSSYISYQFTDRNNYEELNSNRFFKDTLVAQRAYTRYPSSNHYASGGIEYEASKKWMLGFDTRLSLNNNNSYATNDADIITVPTSTITTQTNSLITNNGSSTYFGNSINAKYKIDSAGSVWTASMDYDRFSNKNTQLYNNAFVLPSLPTISGDGKLNNKKNIFVAQTDLLLKTKSGYIVESGAKFIYSASKNNALYFVDSSRGRQQDNRQTNRFQYKEQIASAYLQVSKTFFGLTVKPGLRIENTDINGRQLFPQDTTLSIRRTNLFPYVYLRHDIARIFGFMLTGNAIYRRSITRPYYEALNPYPKYVDQFLYDIGNPQLQPQFTTNYEFNIMADQFPIFSIGLNDIKDIFTNVTYQDSTTKIAFRTYDNLGRNKEMYMRVIGGIPPGKKYFFYAGAQYNHVDYTGFYQNGTLNYKRGTWTFFMYHNYKPTQSFNIGINAFMRLRGLQNFYELKSFGQLNITANQAILKKKMNVILSVNDLLRTNKYSFALQQADIRANGSRVNDTRRIGLTLRYNFGIKPKEEKAAFEAPKDIN